MSQTADSNQDSLNNSELTKGDSPANVKDGLLASEKSTNDAIKRSAHEFSADSNSLDTQETKKLKSKSNGEGQTERVQAVASNEDSNSHDIGGDHEEEDEEDDEEAVPEEGFDDEEDDEHDNDNPEDDDEDDEDE